ncbi:MAG: septum site-determining protein MinC [Aquabacterium sp.]|nr:septum site-determining protein MinC [Aquabacterium sp.]
MPPAAPAKPAFDLKSTAWTLTALRLQTADAGALATALDARFADSPGLFDNDPVVIDLSPLREAAAVVDFKALLPHLRRHGMLPIAAQGGSPAQMAAARAVGLAEAPDAPMARADAAPVRDLAREVVREVVREVPVVHEVIHEVVREVEVIRPAPAPASGPAPVMVVDKPLRSGQRVYARGGDLIVLAVVSVGAEVIADGNIHVYGPLRGRAIAGARGDTSARIYCTCLEPQLVSIAGIYRTTETPLAADVLGQAAQVRLDGEKIIVEPLTS